MKVEQDLHCNSRHSLRVLGYNSYLELWDQSHV